MKNILAIVLAGGNSSRMDLPYPKCLLPLASRTIISTTLIKLNSISIKKIVIVIPKTDVLIKKHTGKQYTYIRQNSPLGTANAISAVFKKSRITTPNILISFVDSSSQFSPITIQKFVRKCINNKAKIGITLFPINKKVNSIGNIYLSKDGNFKSVRLKQQKNNKHIGKSYIQGGYWFFNTAWLKNNLHELTRSSINNEYNLTDLLTIAKNTERKILPFIITDLKQWSSINTFDEYCLTINKLH